MWLNQRAALPVYFIFNVLPIKDMKNIENLRMERKMGKCSFKKELKED